MSMYESQEEFELIDTENHMVLKTCFYYHGLNLKEDLMELNETHKGWILLRGQNKIFVNKKKITDGVFSWCAGNLHPQDLVYVRL